MIEGSPELIPDYPAAHSMDTEWYAVDADGNIGIFDTDDVGVLPGGVPFGDSGVSPSESTVPSWELDGVYFEDLAAKAAAVGRGMVYIDDLMELPQIPFKQLHVVRPEPSLKDRFHSFLSKPKENGKFYGVILLADNVDVTQSPWSSEQILLSRHGRIINAQRNGIPESDFLNYGVDRRILRAWDRDFLHDEPWRFGFFQYSLQYDEHGRRRDLSANKYFRDAEPKSYPLTIDSLPEETQKLFEQARIRVRFSETECINVLKHFKRFKTWGEGADIIVDDEDALEPNK